MIGLRPSVFAATAYRPWFGGQIPGIQHGDVEYAVLRTEYDDGPAVGSPGS